MQSTNEHNGSGDTATSDGGHSTPQAEPRKDVAEEPSAEDIRQKDVHRDDVKAAGKWHDFGKLQELATETGGFVSDERRKIACQYLS